ncbi:MAG: hypothetical protein ABIJ00_04540 [Candidatus Eisenbacteria bacterium]
MSTTIPDPCWPYTGFNVHSKVRTTTLDQTGPLLPIVEPSSAPITSPGWRELIKRLYEVDPLICPICGSEMKVIAFITHYEVIDKIIHHLRLIFRCQRPPPPHQQEELY